jgi:hypothetical protein
VPGLSSGDSCSAATWLQPHRRPQVRPTELLSWAQSICKPVRDNDCFKPLNFRVFVMPQSITKILFCILIAYWLCFFFCFFVFFSFFFYYSYVLKVFFFFMVLGFELRTLSLLGRHSTSWAMPPALPTDFVCLDTVASVRAGSTSIFKSLYTQNIF